MLRLFSRADRHSAVENVRHRDRPGPSRVPRVSPPVPTLTRRSSAVGPVTPPPRPDDHSGVDQPGIRTRGPRGPDVSREDLRRARGRAASSAISRCVDQRHHRVRTTSPRAIRRLPRPAPRCGGDLRLGVGSPLPCNDVLRGGRYAGYPGWGPAVTTGSTRTCCSPRPPSRSLDTSSSEHSPLVAEVRVSGLLRA